MKRGSIGIVCFCVASAFAACSFDYGTGEDSGKNKPDIVMEDLEYVRVRDGEPIARFEAEYAERWEERQTMELKNFSFEQLEDEGDTVNARGRAGGAVVQLDSGNITLKDGVRINIESEDYIIRTSGLEWKDKEKTLSGGENAEVDIERSGGTGLTGKGFSADVRSRSWNFTGEVKGRYVEDEDDEDRAEETETGVTEAGEGEEHDDEEAAEEQPPRERPEPGTKPPVPEEAPLPEDK